jgi:hypothetical protein
MSRTTAAITLLIFVSQFATVPIAEGAEVTRAQYVEQSEPICKANTTANRNILKGIRDDVREGKLKVAGGKFSRAARALHQTIQRLEQTPRPAADERILTRWFTHLNSETDLLEKVAGRLRKGSNVDLGQYVLELRHNANVANNVVLTFGFEYCLIQTARYI